MDDRRPTLGGVERVHQPVAEFLIVGQRRQHPGRSRLRPQHARRGGDVPAVDHGEVERHVVPGKLPSPRLLAGRTEYLEAVPFGIKKIGQIRRQRPLHVLHGHHRHDLRVPRQARAGHDQLVREPPLPRPLASRSAGRTGPARAGTTSRAARRQNRRRNMPACAAPRSAPPGTRTRHWPSARPSPAPPVRRHSRSHDPPARRRARRSRPDKGSPPCPAQTGSRRGGGSRRAGRPSGWRTPVPPRPPRRG